MQSAFLTETGYNDLRGSGCTRPYRSLWEPITTGSPLPSLRVLRIRPVDGSGGDNTSGQQIALVPVGAIAQGDEPRGGAVGYSAETTSIAGHCESGLTDIDRVMDDDVLAEGPRFGDERLAAADHHGEGEETLDRRGGTSLVDDIAEQHSPNGTCCLDVEVVGHPPLSIARCQREQAPAER